MFRDHFALSPSSSPLAKFPKKSVLSLLVACQLAFPVTTFAAPPVGAKVEREVVVKTARVEHKALEQVIEMIGKLEAKQAVALVPKLAGTVTQIQVSDNQYVNRGDVVAQLDDRRARASLSEAQANLNDAQRKLQEFQALRRSNSVAKSEIAAQENVVMVAKARLEMAQTELDEHQVKAPFAGYVGLVDFAVGEQVSTGTSLLSLDDLSQLIVDLPVPERYFSQLKKGMTVKATSQAWLGNEFHGTVIAIDPRINPNTLNLTVRVAFDNPEMKLMPGMMLAADLALPAIERPIIPVQALEYAGTKRFVYRVMPDSTVKRTEVVLGARIGDQVLINSGLAVDDEIVVQGLVNMRDGLKIKVLSESLIDADTRSQTPELPTKQGAQG